MGRMNFFVFVLILLLGGCFAMGCGGGSGSSAPAAIAPDGSGGDSGTVSGGGADEGGPSGTAALAWDAPVTNEDGTALDNLAGYRVYYGTSPRTYTDTLDVGNTTTCSISGLQPGTYYMTVTAYSTDGAESGYSNEVTKTVP